MRRFHEFSTGGVNMSSSFERLDESKKKTILDAALTEFSQYGYQNASTNRIVANAGISKGLFFHYFGSKEGLFHYLVDYAVDFANRVMDEIDPDLTDPIEKWEQGARLKFRYMIDQPLVFEFLARVFLHELGQLPPETRRRIEDAIESAQAQMNSGIDTNHVRDDIDPTHAYKIFQWSIEGFRQQVMEEFRSKPFSSIDTGPYWNEFHTLLTVLRKILYRQEGDASDRRDDA